MKTLISIDGIADNSKIMSGLSEISSSGFRNIQLDTRCLGKKFSDSDMKLITSVFKKNNISVSAVKAHEGSIETAIKTLKICGEINCHYAVIPPVSTDSYEDNKKFYMQLRETAMEYDVKILIENVCKNFNGHFIRGFCSEYDAVYDFIEALNSESDCFGLCCDTGALKLCGIDMTEYIMKLSRYIEMVRIRENNGHENYSGMLLSDNKEWQGAAAGLRKIRFGGMLVFDIKDAYLSFPLILRSKLIKFIKELSDYFEWVINYENLLKKYSHIVIFGAKKMLEYYMADYGEKYPPLFVCDNNKNIWGEKKFGIEICSPEKLYDIPENCGIIICSIYYIEIKEQLQNMGLKNIEYFYDEC